MSILSECQIRSCRKVNVRLKGDKYDPDITGCAFMPNGYLVACDRNGIIKLFDCSWSVVDSLKLSAELWDISVIDDKTVIVTIPHEQQLRYVQVFPELKLGRALQLLEKWCWGIDVIGQEIYVSCDSGKNDGDIRVLDIHGTNVKRQYGCKEDGHHLFMRPFHISVSSTGENIFVSESGTNSLTCLNVAGGKISNTYTYKDADLKIPRGVYCDDEDNVILCGHSSNNIQVVTPDGKKHHTLLSSQDGLVRPESVAYRKTDDTLVVGCFKSDHILVCQLSK